jgi:anti-sigma B factor antagonist
MGNRTDTLAITEHELEGGGLLLELEGELDLATAAGLRDVFAVAEEAGYERVVVDLSAVSAVDSTGLAVLVAVHKHLARSRGELVVVVENEQVAAQIKITSLDRLFTLCTSRDEALRR